MDFKDQIKLLSERVIKLKENTQTEEATKTAFICHFFKPSDMMYSTRQRLSPNTLAI